jgi:hypothetical protein
MLTDTFIRGLGAFDGAFLQVVPSLSTLLQRGRDAIAGFGNPFTGHVRRLRRARLARRPSVFEIRERQHFFS